MVLLALPMSSLLGFKQNLEFGILCFCLMSLHEKRCREDIEGQQKFTKRVKGMRDLSYTGILAKLKLPSLKFRRIRGDMIVVGVYQILL